MKANACQVARRHRRITTGHRGWQLLVVVATLTLSTLVCVTARAVDESFEQRRIHVESMSAAEKEQLKRNHQRFMQMDERKRQELRELHQKIAASPQRERLASVMLLYHQWLQSLSAGERLQLLELPADQRLRAIKKLIERQEREQFQVLVQKSLSAEDREAIIDWLAGLIMERLPRSEQLRLRAINQPFRQRMETMATFRRRVGGVNDIRFLERLKPTAEERNELASRLSPAAQDTIAAAQDDPEKRRLIQSWVNAAIFSRRGSSRVATDVLETFFAGLDADERDYLNNLPPDRKRKELEQLYMRNRTRRPGELRPPFPPNGRRRGEFD